MKYGTLVTTAVPKTGLDARNGPRALSLKTVALLHQTREQILLTLNVVLTYAKDSGEGAEAARVCSHVGRRLPSNQGVVTL